MSRHRTDVFSLVAGVVFLGLAVVYGVGAYTSVHVDGRVVLPALLVLLGVSGLLGAVIAQRRSDELTNGAVDVDGATTNLGSENC